jgi:hypothetical protein
MYSRIELFPAPMGAVHVTVAELLPRTAVTDVGAAGNVAGTTELDDTESAPVPTAFTAATLNVYDVPFARPVTICDTAVPINTTDVCAVLPTNGVTI